MLRTTREGPARFRVTRDVYGPSGGPYGRSLRARQGEIVSKGEAVRRGLDETDLEPAGGREDGGAVFKALVRRERATTFDATTTELVDTDRSEDADVEPEPAPPEPAVTSFPHHRGGAWWTLSNGETFQGSKADAEAAEAALHDGQGGEGEA